MVCGEGEGMGGDNFAASPRLDKYVTLSGPFG